MPHSRRAHSAINMDDEHYYQTVADELREGRINDALWTKAIAKSMGDDNKTKAVYIQLRVDHLIEEERRSQAKERLQEQVTAESDGVSEAGETKDALKEFGWNVLKGILFVVGVYLIYKYLFPLGRELRGRLFD